MYKAALYSLLQNFSPQLQLNIVYQLCQIVSFRVLHWTLTMLYSILRTLVHPPTLYYSQISFITPIQIGFLTFGHPLLLLPTDVFNSPPIDMENLPMLHCSFCTTWLGD